MTEDGRLGAQAWLLMSEDGRPGSRDASSGPRKGGWGAQAWPFMSEDGRLGAQAWLLRSEEGLPGSVEAVLGPIDEPLRCTSDCLAW
jgi:hypothetical protein